MFSRIKICTWILLETSPLGSCNGWILEEVVQQNLEMKLDKVGIHLGIIISYVVKLQTLALVYCTDVNCITFQFQIANEEYAYSMMPILPTLSSSRFFASSLWTMMPNPQSQVAQPQKATHIDLHQVLNQILMSPPWVMKSASGA